MLTSIRFLTKRSADIDTYKNDPDASASGSFRFQLRLKLFSLEKLVIAVAAATAVAEADLRLTVIACTVKAVVRVACVALEGYLKELLENAVESDHNSADSYNSTYNDK